MSSFCFVQLFIAEWLSQSAWLILIKSPSLSPQSPHKKRSVMQSTEHSVMAETPLTQNTLPLLSPGNRDQAASAVLWDTETLSGVERGRNRGMRRSAVPVTESALQSSHIWPGAVEMMSAGRSGGESDNALIAFVLLVQVWLILIKIHDTHVMVRGRSGDITAWHNDTRFGSDESLGSFSVHPLSEQC